MSNSAGDPLDQITEVLARQQASLKGLAYHAVAARGARPSREDVEDIVSDAYLDAAKRCARDDLDLASPEAWFRRVVFHRCLHFLRRRAKDPVDQAVLDALQEDNALFLEIEAWDPDRRILVEQLAGQTAPEDREILQRFARGWTSREIGEELDLNPATVRKRLSRVMASLRRVVRGGPSEDDEPSHPP